MEVNGHYPTPADLSPGDRVPRYALDERLDEPYSPSGFCGEDKMPYPLRESNRGRLAGCYTDSAIALLRAVSK
jgi:hypothetical protein